jgi:hypothetical protein
LKVATLWLLALCEPSNGQVPNLGANDGSNILPFSGCPVEDYRAVLQAASLAYAHRPTFPQGDWDEQACWLGMGEPPFTGALHEPVGQKEDLQIKFPTTLHIPEKNSWAYLRCTRYENRPSHADQLHLDLWWQGTNIAQDAGSYLYNAASPWDNALQKTEVHNTLTINGLDQMQPAGRFLWLDWAQGHLIEHVYSQDGAWERLIAGHEGRWRVLDQLSAVDDKDGGSLGATLQWLLPDWEWQMVRQEAGEIELEVSSPHGNIGLVFHANKALNDTSAKLTLQVVRAGKLVYGEGRAEPSWGWVSRTYGYKEPALSLRISVQGKPPFEMLSDWTLA